jgi:hypothetical protein
VRICISTSEATKQQFIKSFIKSVPDCGPMTPAGAKINFESIDPKI